MFMHCTEDISLVPRPLRVEGGVWVPDYVCYWVRAENKAIPQMTGSINNGVVIASYSQPCLVPRLEYYASGNETNIYSTHMQGSGNETNCLVYIASTQLYCGTHI